MKFLTLILFLLSVQASATTVMNCVNPATGAALSIDNLVPEARGEGPAAPNSVMTMNSRFNAGECEFF